MYSPEYMPAVMRIIKRVIPKATTPQATKVAAGCVNATWSPKIDYENYEIPSYARRGGAQ
ncbi:hypothetical protein FQZ97_1157140 [compost metagenome]